MQNVRYLPIHPPNTQSLQQLIHHINTISPQIYLLLNRKVPALPAYIQINLPNSYSKPGEERKQSEKKHHPMQRKRERPNLKHEITPTSTPDHHSLSNSSRSTKSQLQSYPLVYQSTQEIGGISLSLKS